ncbi:MAG: flagellar assembly protein T N-terminal domain-containing protein [Deltaproteobacteria bacterium]|nr:flagellar assembly protein T N-terminal domain-containing protein [Deltaproteobacteria bacterium]
MKKNLFFLILIALFFALPSALAQHRVKAEGTATIHNNLIDIARDKAIENAQRNAVERAVGVMISSSTEVENYQVKMDRILSESQGFINEYKILSENRAENQYKVVIDADVGLGKLKDRMKAINLVMVRKDKPRLMIIFTDREPKDVIAEASMAKSFLSRGFRIIDAQVINNARERNGLPKMVSDSRETAKAAHDYGAEIVILGRTEATSTLFTISGVDMHSNKVIVSVKIMNADTGEIIATDSEIASAPGLKGDFKAVTEQASGALAKKMMNNVLERWSSELANTVTVNLMVSGLGSYEDLLKFKELLSTDVKGFKQLFQRTYQNGIVELDIEIKGNTQSLADDLAAITLNDRHVKILEITPNRIKAQAL